MKVYKTLSIYLTRIRGANITFMDVGTKKQLGLFIPFRGNAVKQGDDYVLKTVIHPVKNKFFKRIKHVFKNAFSDGVFCSTYILRQKQKQDFYDEELLPIGYVNEYIYDEDGTMNYDKYLKSQKKNIKDVLNK